MRDTANAFIDMFTLHGATDGVLRGLTFGAKDLFDVAGHITCLLYTSDAADES